MFDIGFWELILIAIITLLVVGPERLPGVSRSAGYWLAKLRRFTQTVKQDMERELAAGELRQTLKRQANIPELEEIIEETENVIKDTIQVAGTEYSQPV